MQPFNIKEFEWDEGNCDKSLIKHNVTNEEAEDAFSDPDAIVFKGKDNRYILLARTAGGRYLFQVFIKKTGGTIRIISSRDQSKKDKKHYLKK